MAVVPLTPSLFDLDYGASAQISATLEPPWTSQQTFADLVTSVRNEVAVDENDLRSALVLLQSWHTMFVGPPGTGKTLLAEVLADRWNVDLKRVTPSMDWTAFHAVGGLVPSAGGLAPYDGAVTNAVLECCKTTTRHQATGTGKQATWLLIDEINRCEADRVFAQLLTTLGSRTRPAVLELPHQQDLPKQTLTLPPTFRIVATANLSDAQFVEQFSQAFLRRFQRIEVRPPSRPPDSAPIASIIAAGDPSAESEPFLQEMAVISRQVNDLLTNAPDFTVALTALAQLVMLVRYDVVWDGPGQVPRLAQERYDTVAVGTAQVVDALLLALDLHQSPAGYSLLEATDVAAARTIVPQLSRAGAESVRAIDGHLDALNLFPTVRAELTLLLDRFETGSFL
jgi:5-methylcytosine-specific restriction enzyme B